MTDLVERLRDAWRAHFGSSLNHGCVDCGLSADLCSEAADRIECMRVALQMMVYETTHLSPMEPDGSHWCLISAATLGVARAALGETK